MTAYAECRYCRGRGCLACEGEAARGATLPVVPRTIPSVNPMVAQHGAGPEGATCGGCSHLFGIEYSRRYWKCELRGLTHGPGTDMRKRWPACAKYEAGTPETFAGPH